MPNYALYDPQSKKMILIKPQSVFDDIVKSSQLWANRLRKPIWLMGQPFHFPGGQKFQGYTQRLYTAKVKCPSCGGNDQDMPCAYPSGRKLGCLRDERIA